VTLLAVDFWCTYQYSPANGSWGYSGELDNFNQQWWEPRGLCLRGDRCKLVCLLLLKVSSLKGGSILRDPLMTPISRLQIDLDKLKNEAIPEFTPVATPGVISSLLFVHREEHALAKSRRGHYL
jgi:hypothetical protein